jgi:hypothetical protein
MKKEGIYEKTEKMTKSDPEFARSVSGSLFQKFIVCTDQSSYPDQMFVGMSGTGQYMHAYN